MSSMTKRRSERAYESRREYYRELYRRNKERIAHSARVRYEVRIRKQYPNCSPKRNREFREDILNEERKKRHILTYLEESRAEEDLR